MNEDINYEEFELSKEEEEYLYAVDENTKVFNTNLPSFIRRFQQDAVKVAFKNDIPAALSCFVILGQIVKDFVQIPNGRSIEDSRVHFCQIQTSGSGKSTLWAFLKPVTKKLFNKINDSGGHPVNRHVSSDGSVDYAQWDGEGEVPTYASKQFNIMSTTEYTDAALIGGHEEEMVEKEEDGNTKKVLEWVRDAGLLEGSGLAHWDEFEYSGVFKQSQNKEQAIVYLNTLMNTLAGESWQISKKLKRGNMMNCYCERSILAMTYPPEKLAKVIANKGVLQRMILFIWDVPESMLDIMRRMQISKAGKLEEINAPIEAFADEFFDIYELMKARFEEVGKDPLKAMNYTQDFNDVLLVEYETMQKFISSSDPVVRKIASNFTTRLLKILIKMSVLCSIAEAKDIKNKKKRYTVSGRNVRQAGNIVRQCYNTLVLWLERSLKVSRRVGKRTQSPNEQVFLETLRQAELNENGFFSKAKQKDILAKSMNVRTAERLFKKYEDEGLFEVDKIGRSYYLKLKEEKK
tara:strand:- start:802 stop:2358 length:1557 start_codon:yes stop_codon:yes gene_type:complete